MHKRPAYYFINCVPIHHMGWALSQYARPIGRNTSIRKQGVSMKQKTMSLIAVSRKEANPNYQQISLFVHQYRVSTGMIQVATSQLSRPCYWD